MVEAEPTQTRTVLVLQNPESWETAGEFLGALRKAGLDDAVIAPENLYKPRAGGTGREMMIDPLLAGVLSCAGYDAIKHAVRQINEHRPHWQIKIERIDTPRSDD